MRRLVGIVILLAVTQSAVARAEETRLPGLITYEGPAGLFINPTSSTLPRGSLTAQYCFLVYDQRDRTVMWHQGMAAYGITDWLEVGAIGVVESFDSSNHTIAAGGPLLRLRVLPEGGLLPELSVGGFLREGNDLLTRRTVFAAASRRFPIADDGIVRALRLHAGVRQFWQDGRVNEGDASILFVGAELELPNGVFLVGEVSTKDDVFRRTPFAVGIQVRRGSFGFTGSVLQTGNQDGIGVYLGIGINF